MCGLLFCLCFFCVCACVCLCACVLCVCVLYWLDSFGYTKKEKTPLSFECGTIWRDDHLFSSLSIIVTSSHKEFSQTVWTKSQGRFLQSYVCKPKINNLSNYEHVIKFKSGTAHKYPTVHCVHVCIYVEWSSVVHTCLDTWAFLAYLLSQCVVYAANMTTFIYGYISWEHTDQWPASWTNLKVSVMITRQMSCKLCFNEFS